MHFASRQSTAPKRAAAADTATARDPAPVFHDRAEPHWA